MKLVALFLLCLGTHGLAAPNVLKLRPSGASTRIVGGADAELEEFPYQVSYQQEIQIQGQGVWFHICGGSIVNENWVITAALCIVNDEVRVVAGILNLDDGNDVETKEVRSIKRQIVHENFHGELGGSPNDIAVVELAEPLVWNDAVRPIPLAECGAETEGDVELSGWGADTPLSGSGTTNHLQKATVTIVSNSECKEAVDNILGALNPWDDESNLCTGPLDSGVAACVGDTGGPLTDDGTLLVGISSWGIMPCGEVGAPSVYTKVSSFCEWIEEKIGS